MKMQRWQWFLFLSLPIVISGQGFWRRPPPIPRILSFSLIETVTGTVVATISDGDSFELADTGTSLTVRADVVGRAGSVLLSMSGSLQARMENGRPYLLGGDDNGAYLPVPDLAVPDTYTVFATTFTDRDGNGSEIESASITFSMINVNSINLRVNLTNCELDPEPVPLNTTDVPEYVASLQGSLNGELLTWHKVTLGFEGPMMCERAEPNPFVDMSLEVTFVHEDTLETYLVPGYYAADGNAANTGAKNGNIWLVHFTPNLVGNWTYSTSFTIGNKAALYSNGTTAGYFDGATGRFAVLATNKTGRDLRGKGRLEYVGEHHLRFAETDEWFLKAGSDSPENFLAYADFDNTPNIGDRRKTWEPHVQDYEETDPTFAGGKGRGIIGAINYLSGEGMNVFSFLTMNIEGDDENVFPYVSDSAGDDRLRIDVSKTAQWEVLFEHADHIGMYLHFKTQETENDQLLDGGELGDERILYYRELIARFSHHLALNWNIGEETTNTNLQLRQFAAFFKDTDPYQHPVVVHTYPTQKERRYAPLLGNADYDGASLQSNKNTVFSDTLEWVTRSAESGHKWVVANDEQGNAEEGVLPDSEDPNHAIVRKEVLWGNLMAGGAGVEYYFGYAYNHSDLTAQDFRSRDTMWKQSKHALDFFVENNIPFWDMSYSDSTVVTGTNDVWALQQSNNETIVLYLKTGGTASVALTSSYTVQWWDPRNGGRLWEGSVPLIEPSESGSASIGAPPRAPNVDWAVLLRATTD